MKPMVLITGGAGYIGSHSAIELIAAGYEVLILDNLCNSNERVIERLERICGRPIKLIKADARDPSMVRELFEQYEISAVMHFAGYKAVGESVSKPLAYFDNNIVSMLTVLQAMQDANVKRFVFSSSATVYGTSAKVPITEESALNVTNPYGRTKLICEDILRDFINADAECQVAILRYFNPVGAHESGLIGESPKDIPNNLMPYITQVAVRKREKLSVYGDDYPTPDGTGVRDFIHVVDLAKGHVAALQALERTQQSLTVNLGTGKGTSVLQLLHTFQRITHQEIPYQIVPRRAGDIACCYADVTLANRLLAWHAERDIEAMCRDAWRWQSMNPDGY